MARRAGATIVVSGPLFQRDVFGLVRAAVDEAVREVTEFAGEVVDAQLFPGHGVRTGKFKASITAEFTQSRHGVLFARDVAYGPWLEGTSRRNRTTRFKGYRMFRRARTRTNKEAQKIADKIIGGVVRRLS